MRNSIHFRLWGNYALFTDPLSVGGEKCSYQVPTYQALVGICESIYWKPTFLWVIDELRVINKIITEPKSIRPINYGGGNDLAIYTYLCNVEYQVSAHFEWNYTRDDLINDRNENKHHNIAKRMLEKGGRLGIFLGTSECRGYVEPCEFGCGAGFYDGYGQMQLGVMFHGFDYPNITGSDKLYARLWRPTMNDGVIVFPSHMNDVGREQMVIREMRKMSIEPVNTCGAEDKVIQEEMGW